MYLANHLRVSQSANEIKHYELVWYIIIVMTIIITIKKKNRGTNAVVITNLVLYVCDFKKVVFISVETI